MKAKSKVKNFVKALVTRTLDFEIERMPFRLENLSTTKLISTLRSELNCARDRPKEPLYPSRLMIEPSSACTLSCPLCPVGRGVMTRPAANMSMQTYRTLMDEVGGHAIYIQLWMYGEPFLNPQLPEMISYARERNVATATSTNGQHVQTREEAESLVSSGLDNLIVALDGASQETFGRYRRGGEIARVLRCVELVSQAKKALGSRKPGINVRTVVMKQNEHELAEIARLAKLHGADMISRKTAFMSDYVGSSADRDFAPADPQYQRFKYQAGRRSRGELFRCRRPWDRLSVTAEGTVLSCEYDFNESEPWGRGDSGQSFMAIWRGRTARAFRRQFLIDETVYPFCANCSCGWVGSKEATTKEMVHLTGVKS